ncbi:hypothetical protein LguiA_010074 [Lonicera macranthoides]
MAESSFEIDRRQRRRHPTPNTSHQQSPAFSYSTSTTHQFSQYPSTTPRRSRNPTTPFAADYDTSWQTEVSWQFAPTGWRDTRNHLGAALSPWAPTTPSPTGNRYIFRRTANDYYLSKTTTGNFSSFANNSRYYGALPSGRLELQSYVASARDNIHTNTNNTSRGSTNYSYTSRESSRSPNFLKLAAISNNDSKSPLADEDELKQVEQHIHAIKPDPNTRKDPRWLSVSQAYMDDYNYNTEEDEIEHTKHELKSIEKKRHFVDDIVGRQSIASHHYRDDGFGDFDREFGSEEEEGFVDEDEIGARKTVGLFSLFKYSTKLDMLMIILGCVGAFINGGSLPWYSLLFGTFVNKIAENDKDQMMRRAEKVAFQSLY